MAVRIDTQTFRDPRFRLMASMCGIDHWSARARCEDVWEYCTEQCAYSVQFVLLSAIVGGENIAKAMIDAGLAEHDGDVVRIKGTRGRIEWLNTKRKALKSVRKKRWKNTTDEQQTSVTDIEQTSVTDTQQMVDRPEEKEKEKEKEKELINKKDVGIDFESAWKNYPRSVGAKDGARKKWETLNPDEQRLAFERIGELSKNWEHLPVKDRDKCPYFATWLNGGYWKSEEQPRPFANGAGKNGPSARDTYQRALELEALGE